MPNAKCQMPNAELPASYSDIAGKVSGIVIFGKILKIGTSQADEERTRRDLSTRRRYGLFFDEETEPQKAD